MMEILLGCCYQGRFYLVTVKHSTFFPLYGLALVLGQGGQFCVSAKCCHISIEILFPTTGFKARGPTKQQHSTTCEGIRAKFLSFLSQFLLNSSISIEHGPMKPICHINTTVGDGNDFWGATAVVVVAQNDTRVVVVVVHNCEGPIIRWTAPILMFISVPQAQITFSVLVTRCPIFIAYSIY